MNKILLILFLFCSNVLFGQQTIKNLQWLNVDQEITELTLGYELTLYAETENINDNETVTIAIWEKGDGADYLVGEYISRVTDNKISFNWTLVYEKERQTLKRDLYKNGYTVQYYFKVQHNKIISHKSKLLDVLAWVSATFTYQDGTPIAHHHYTILLPDNTTIEGRTDANGYFREENIKLWGKLYYYLSEEEEKDDHVEPVDQEPEQPKNVYPQYLEPADINRFKEHLSEFPDFFHKDIFHTNGDYYNLFRETLINIGNIYEVMDGVNMHEVETKMYSNLSRKQIIDLLNYDAPEVINSKYRSMGLLNNGHKKITTIIFGALYIDAQETLKLLRLKLEEGDIEGFAPEEVEEMIKMGEIFLDIHSDIFNEQELDIIKNDMGFVNEIYKLIPYLTGG